MAWQEESSLYIELTEGKVVEGTLIGIDDVEIPGKEDTARRYTFQDRDGVRVSFLGGASLDRVIDEKQIKPGEVLRVKHCGEKDLKGGKKVKLFRVWRWTGEEPPNGSGAQPA